MSFFVTRKCQKIRKVCQNPLRKRVNIVLAVGSGVKSQFFYEKIGISPRKEKLSIDMFLIAKSKKTKIAK